MRFKDHHSRLLFLAFACLGGVLALAGCGGGSSTTGAGATSTEKSNSSAANSKLVQEAEQRVKEAEKPLTEFPGPTEPAGAPPAGKSIASVKVLPGPFPDDQEAGLEAAVKAVGWNLRTFTANGTPHGFETAMQSAMSTKPDAIVLLAMPAALIQKQLSEAKDAGIPVIALSPGLPRGKTPEQWNLLNEMREETAEAGEVLADYVIKSSPEGAEALALTSPEFVDIQEASESFQKVIGEAGSNFSVPTVVTSPVTDSSGGQTGVNRLASPMRKYPGAGYFFINSESWVPTFLQAAQSANRAGAVTALGLGGDVSIPLIKEGQPIVFMAPAVKSMGWYAADALIRLWNGKEQQKYDVPLTLVDSENADEYETPGVEAKYDVAKEWEKLWK